MKAHIHTEDEWPAAAERFVSFSLREEEADVCCCHHFIFVVAVAKN